MQQHARALGDPTRHAIHRAIVEAERPVAVGELAERFAVHPNAVRQHLAKLVAVGLVLENRNPRPGRGAARLTYTAAPGTADPAADPYRRLSRLLVTVARTGRSPEDVGREAAVEVRPAARSGDPVTDLAVAMGFQGFAPEVRRRRAGDEVVLQRCPFATAAAVDRLTVCSLHLGIAEGLLDGSPVAVDELVADDPHRAGCRIRTAPAPSTPAATARLSLRRRRR